MNEKFINFLRLFIWELKNKINVLIVGFFLILVYIIE